jgi:NAD(P)H-dependent FMN reductase
MTTILTVCGSLQRNSANRAALEVVRRHLVSLGASVDEFDHLALVPPLDVDTDHAPGVVVVDWRRRIAAAEAVVIAAPEYGGAIAGTIKNALDWIVGSGELYGKPVAIVSAGTSGGVHARRMLVQTLTWQGAHVVAQVGISSPRTKSDATGAFTDRATIVAIEQLTDTLLAVLGMAVDERLALVRAIVDDAGVDPAHISPIVASP